MTHDQYLSDSVWADLFAKQEQVHDLGWFSRPTRFVAGDRIRAMISRQAIEHWVAYGNLRYPQISLNFAGHAAPPTSFTWTRRLGDRQLVGCADPPKIEAQLAEGATMVLINVEHWHEPLGLFCTRLGDATGAAVETYGYLTAPDQFGSQPHRDTAHVFVVQIEGNKRWTLYDIPDDDDWERGIIPGSTPVSEQLELEPGDGLYLPPGLGHRAQAGSEGSLHLTISVQPPAVSDVVAAWARLMGRRQLPQSRLPLGSAARVAAVRSTLASLGVEITGTTAAEVASLVASWQRQDRD
ncbi:JmjC domain-containing protein [Asanoa siamensis]|uniref:JmjC domain-containing protein n=1 Tax=Asanoa siamensis TaxID=926357 RepID=A0ABQ4CQK1_9ACTN|nr:cupin domain-containing protein [Asanoa siamensis]GIF73576.1 hypothetical protein Asi02nite_30940 [Asanoa siamensis]